MPKGKPHLYKEGGLIESLRAKHDPHYKLASKVAGLQDSGEQVDKLGKEIGIKIQGIHKTLGKSFGMQRKTLQPRYPMQIKMQMNTIMMKKLMV